MTSNYTIRPIILDDYEEPTMKYTKKELRATQEALIRWEERLKAAEIAKEFGLRAVIPTGTLNCPLCAVFKYRMECRTSTDGNVCPLKVRDNCCLHAGSAYSAVRNAAYRLLPDEGVVTDDVRSIRNLVESLQKAVKFVKKNRKENK